MSGSSQPAFSVCPRPDSAVRSGPPKLTGPQRVLITASCLLGLAICSFNWIGFVPYFFRGGNNDFVMTYVGARLAGSGKLYDRAATVEIEQHIGDRPQYLINMRLPFYAALSTPLRFLTYKSAYWVWQSLSAAAVLLFVIIWPFSRRWIAALACCWSLPLIGCFIMGQDITLVIAALAVGLALFQRGKHFAAGIVISLCSIKFQFFFTLPLLILARRWWRFSGGILAGGAVLAAISFLSEGWFWPVEYWRMLHLSGLTPSYDLMPNLNGLFAAMPDATVWIALASVGVVAAAWYVMRTGDSYDAFAAMLISGLLLSYHAFIADGAILIPSGLLLLRNSARLGYRAVALMLLSSFAFIPFRLQHPPYESASIILLALLALAAIPAAQRWWPQRRLPVVEPDRIAPRAGVC